MAATSASSGSTMSSICAPAARSACSARSKARATVASSASSSSVRGTREPPAGERPRVELHACAAPAPRASRSRRARRRVIAHTVSSVVDSGTVPSSGVSRCVFLKPTRPCSAAGMRIEPPVSEPSAASAAPAGHRDRAARGRAARARAACASSAASAALAGVPKCGLMPTPENANSLMLVWPISTAPACAQRARPPGCRARRPAHRASSADAGGRGEARHVEQVLDRDRRAGQRAERRAGTVHALQRAGAGRADASNGG